MDLTPLPEAPDTLSGPVKAWTCQLTLPTYEPEAPDRNPMFLETRVFQGSSGRVYPLPFYDRISRDLIMKDWLAINLENEYLQVTILPELGGRIYAMVDKINGYDVIYRNRVIKPALVGLAGPWVSGGIEFNWPQHHRPSTYMPCSWTIEEEDDGGRIVWLSENEPMNRMKGMHGIRLSPGSSALELKARLHNRTEMTQTFLWWANVATDVSENYQSFFPEDVHVVADHAKRAVSAFPFCAERYYGVNYGERARSGVPEAEMPAQFVPHDNVAANDLRWYSNIPVPTSYMCLGSKHDFFGGYDHGLDAGIVHIADHHISPGKKQWTWGNHDFGYAWDRNLTEPDENGVYRPYIEIMAGVYTDNQPDFAFLAPGETKTFSQYWYPVRQIGPAVAATLDVAVGLKVNGAITTLGIQATRAFKALTIAVGTGAEELHNGRYDIAPDAPLLLEIALPEGVRRDDIVISVYDDEGRLVARRDPQEDAPTGDIPPTASEPPAPEDIESNDELWVTGLHLDQYRHATRAAEPYWREALKRDPLDSRCNTALGIWHLRRAEFGEAETHLRNAVTRLTRRNPNPVDGEALYYLGITLRYRGDRKAAYDALAKAAWNEAWQGPAYLAMAEIEASSDRFGAALANIEAVLNRNSDNTGARNLKAILLRKTGRDAEADALLAETLKLDPLDGLALLLSGANPALDDQEIIDHATVNARAGFYREAFDLICAKATQGQNPMLHYYAAYYAENIGDTQEAEAQRKRAEAAPSDYCFPARIEDVLVLEAAIRANPDDARAPYYLGNLLYDRRRHEEAIALWEKAAKRDPAFATTWRNLGIGYFNILSEPAKALDAYDRAFVAASDDARLLYERDQLWKRIGRSPAERLAVLSAHQALVEARDDLSIEYCALLNQTRQPEKADEIIAARSFQPWEGGEGTVLGQWERTKLMLARKAIEAGNPSEAIAAIDAALKPPHSLGEARHLLANNSDLLYWMGRACEAAGDHRAANGHYRLAADFSGDFLGMEVKAYSEKTYFSIMSLFRLGRDDEAQKLIAALSAYAEEMMTKPAKIDYFATSLPTMLLFADDLQLRNRVSALVMLAQAALCRGETDTARDRLKAALKDDPHHALAADLLGETETGAA